MRRLPGWWLVPSLALAAACGKAADKPAESAPAEPAAAPAPAGPKAIVTVIYNTPKDTAAFEKYYRETHLPLVSANQSEIGFVRADLTRFTSNLDGSKPKYYRQAELYFPSLDAARKGMATPGFKKVADDLANFASGGLTGLLALETHGPLVDANQAEIGFTKAEFTKFESNLDGSAPALYRQAELYFPSMAALKKGTATAGFKKVADDLANFATGGVDALVAVETR